MDTVTNLFQLLTNQVKERPDQPALISGNGKHLKVTTFKELKQRSLLLARQLRHQGICPGSRVLVLCPISTNLYAILLALFRLKAAALIVDPGQGLAFVDSCVKSIAPQSVIFCGPSLMAPLLCPSIGQIPLKLSIGDWFGLPRLHRFSPIDPAIHHVLDFTPEPSPVALITATSGSTGRPKFICRTHEFLLAQHASISQTLQLVPGTMHMTTLPVFIISNLAAGVTTILPATDLKKPGRIATAPVVAQLNRLKPETLVAPPAFLQAIAQHCRNANEELPSLRRIYTGGAPVFSQLLRKLMVVAPAAKIIAVYGSSEAEPIAHVDLSAAAVEATAAQAQGRGLLSGTVAGCTQIRVISSPQGQACPATAAALDKITLPAGQAGEIIVSGPHVVQGYLDPADDSQTKIRVDGTIWHRTGDAGYLDDCGRLWLLGRVSAAITSGAGTLFPFAVEASALEWPNITRAALIEQDRQCLLVVERDRQAPMPPVATMQANLRRQFGIDRLIVVDKIPVDPRHNSKVDYSQLHRMLATRAA